MEINTENNINNKSTEIVTNSQVLNERRQCWLCLNDEEVGEDPHNCWLSPCRCSGTAKWVHNQCLQLWIDEKQRLDSNVVVKCSQCNTKYELVFPPNGILVEIILWYESLLNKASTYGMIACIAGSIYISAFSYGIVTLIQIIGTEKANQLFEDTDKALLMIGLPSIPLFLCAGKLIGWENMFLRLWRRHYHRMPLLRYLTGSPSEGNIRESAERNLLGRDNAIQIQRNNGAVNHIEINVSGTAICRAFCGALLLPTVGKIVGQYLYDSVESDLHKTILGGMTFIVIKGCVKIYLRQQLFIKQTKRQILNFNETIHKSDSN